jgi:hypothetical protein
MLVQNLSKIKTIGCIYLSLTRSKIARNKYFYKLFLSNINGNKDDRKTLTVIAHQRPQK